MGNRSTLPLELFLGLPAPGLLLLGLLPPHVCTAATAIAAMAEKTEHSVGVVALQLHLW
jgi:hypothetical protein